MGESASFPGSTAPSGNTAGDLVDGSLALERAGDIGGALRLAQAALDRARASGSAGDMAAAVKTAIINKRAGGMGLISGRKAFQRPMKEGIELLNAIQDVYLDPAVGIA